VTNVIRKASGVAWLVAVLASGLFAQNSAPAQAPGPAESLYLKLRSVGLDKARVYKIRNGALDRASIHLSFDDGTIAFTEDAGGHITGALFLGDGDILVSPPNAAERSSLALFTGAAILEEKLSLAYLRFNDDLYDALRPALRPTEDAESFVNLWNPTAKDLAQEDALRLLVSFSQDPAAAAERPTDHLLHGYLRGRRLGTFDVRYDSTLQEQISAGQHREADGGSYYDLWLSFAIPPPGKSAPLKIQPPMPDFAITQFKIKAHIKIPTELSARAELSIMPNRAGNRILLFELSRLLQVKSVEADGHPVEFIHNQAIEGSQLARRGDDALAVFLLQPLPPGQSIQLTFEYSGTVLSEAANGLLYVGEHGTWYPNVGFAMSRFDLEFHYPAGWTLVATGVRSDTKIEAAEQVSHWASERPVPVAGFNLGKYSRSVTTAGKVTVETYATTTVERNFPKTTDNQPVTPDLFRRPPSPFPVVPSVPLLPPSPAQNTQAIAATAARAIDFYSQQFGPFPYSGLALTQYPGPISQGWPGLIFLSSYAFLNSQEHEHLEKDKAYRLIQEQSVAHETAHQWWGDLVTWNGYRDQWIMEALANYSALMLLETRDPGGFRLVMQKYRDELLNKTRDGVPLMNAGPVTFGLRLSSSRYPNAYEAISYGRGTWLLHMMRAMLRDSQGNTAIKISDEPFVRVLRKLRTDYEGKSLTTAQLLAAFEAELPRSLWYEGHKSLDWFYQGWVNGSAVPQFELRDLKFTDKSTSVLVTGKIVQEDAPETLVTALPIYASIGGRNIFLGRVFVEGHETTFHVSAPVHARKIIIDPEQTVLARSK
jgi:Peptidase family M1 domain